MRTIVLALGIALALTFMVAGNAALAADKDSGKTPGLGGIVNVEVDLDLSLGGDAEDEHDKISGNLPALDLDVTLDLDIGKNDEPATSVVNVDVSADVNADLGPAADKPCGCGDEAQAAGLDIVTGIQADASLDISKDSGKSGNSGIDLDFDVDVDATAEVDAGVIHLEAEADVEADASIDVGNHGIDVSAEVCVDASVDAVAPAHVTATVATGCSTDDSGGSTGEPVEPENPVDPVTPTDPVDPVDPVNPVNPANPGNAGNPAVPVAPVDAVAQADPDEQQIPSGSGNPVDPVYGNAGEVQPEPGTRGDANPPEGGVDGVIEIRPIVPSQPVIPSNPVIPSHPENPQEPSNPVDPADPVDPTDPVTPPVTCEYVRQSGINIHTCVDLDLGVGNVVDVDLTTEINTGINIQKRKVRAGAGVVGQIWFNPAALRPILKNDGQIGLDAAANAGLDLSSGGLLPAAGKGHHGLEIAANAGANLDLDLHLPGVKAEARASIDVSAAVPGKDDGLAIDVNLDVDLETGTSKIGNHPIGLELDVNIQAGLEKESNTPDQNSDTGLSIDVEVNQGDAGAQVGADASLSVGSILPLAPGHGCDDDGTADSGTGLEINVDLQVDAVAGLLKG